MDEVIYFHIYTMISYMENSKEEDNKGGLVIIFINNMGYKQLAKTKASKKLETRPDGISHMLTDNVVVEDIIIVIEEADVNDENIAGLMMIHMQTIVSPHMMTRIRVKYVKNDDNYPEKRMK